MGGKGSLNSKYHYGTFANMREVYLRTHNEALYKKLRDSGELEKHLRAFQAQHAFLAEEMHQRLAKERGVNQQLLMYNMSEWVVKTVEIQEEVRAHMIKLIQNP